MASRPSGSLASRLLRPVVETHPGEATTALLMFAYSFLAMTAYNIIQPITRSKFIDDLGAENIPYVQFAAGLLIGVIMQGYVKATALVPARWVIPAAQACLAAILVVFWVLFQTGAEWVSAAFYLLGLIFAILLVSQFWSLANAIYDPRQAKRLFGFIGGGTALGGMAGAGVTALLATTVGTINLLLWSAATLALCIAIVVFVLRRERTAVAGPGGEEELGGLGPREALRLFATSRQIQLIAVVITFGALGAAILDQQLNMATEEFKSAEGTDSMTAFLGSVRFYLSAAGFVIQVFLTSRIHRLLGIGFALMVLPLNLGVMAGVILANHALWAPALGSVIDRSFRYTVDKTTREILFLPLPLDVKLQAKPFVDVTVDRMAKGVGALMLLVLIQPWGLNLRWQQLSVITLGLVAVWLVTAVAARREYVASFRRSLDQQKVRPSEITLRTADLHTIETLVTELSDPDPRRVIYAMDLLEALDKRHLVTPLLMSHESPQVRRRALEIAASASLERRAPWLRAVERALTDNDGEVRLAAVRALAAMQRENAADMVRGLLDDPDPLIVVTAACALAESPQPDDRRAAEETLRRLASDTREQAAPVRLQIARSLGAVRNPALHPLLVPLMYDPHLEVATAAIQSAGRLQTANVLFVAPLVSLLRHRLLKKAAREVLVAYGDSIVDALAYFLRDPDEDIWVRRHIPSTLALIPTQRSMDVLVSALEHEDGFVRFKAAAAIERLRRSAPHLAIDRRVLERQILRETTRAFNALTLHHNLFAIYHLDRASLLAQALVEKHARALDRIFRLLGQLFTPDDIGAVRAVLRSGDARLRAGALEYLDNLLAGEIRRRVMLLVEDMPEHERIRRGNVIFRTRPRDVEDTLAQLVHDDDQVIAACAISLLGRQRLPSLDDDLEHVLAHRSPRDTYVTEAAAWVLASLYPGRGPQAVVPGGRLPAVELAHRLRPIPLFAFVSVDELFRIATLGQQVQYPAGRVLQEQGRPVEALHLLLEGRVVSSQPGQTDVVALPPAIVGFDAIIEGSPARKTTATLDASACLTLTSEEFLSLLSENVEIAQGIFRQMLERRGGIGIQPIVRGSIPPALQAQIATGAPLQPMDLIRLFQGSRLLRHATAHHLLGLAAIAHRVELRPGADPLAGAEPSMLAVLSGAVRLERPGAAPERAGPGDVIGMYEMLSGVVLPARAEVVDAGSALRFFNSEILDLLADDIGLLRGLFSGLLRMPPAGTAREPQDGAAAAP